jgi:uncharacterized membrane protein HdeD (DUF308 family)
VVLVTRPFTSLSVLVVVTSAAAIITGVTRWVTARTTAGRLDDLAAAGWVALGVVVAAWPDLTVRGLAVIVGLGMVVAGLSDLIGGVRGTEDERLAAVLKGAASVIFGVLALAWPDVTVLVIAVIFGIRTVLFGFAELLTAIRGVRPVEAARREPGLLRRSFHVVTATGALVVALLLGGLSARLHEAERRSTRSTTPPRESPAGRGGSCAGSRPTSPSPAVQRAGASSTRPAWGTVSPPWPAGWSSSRPPPTDRFR